VSQIQTTDWSETAASNNTATPNGWPEGQSAASVNNCARELMSAIKIFWNRTRATVSSTGSDPNYVLTYGTAPPALVNGMRFAFLASFANAGTAPTVNVNSLGAITIKKHGAAGLTAMTAGDIQIGHHVEVEYDSAASCMVIISPIPSATSSFTGGALSSQLNEAKGADIASASTCPIGAATGNYINITGTTTINAFDTVQAGTRRIVNFNGILTLTYNASSLILPTSASIVTAAGDTATFISLGSGNWICTQYQRANGRALVSTAGTTYSTAVILTSGTTWNVPATVSQVMAILLGGGGGGGGAKSTSTNSAAASGGSPGAFVTIQMAVTPSGTVTYSIGTAGTKGSSSPSDGSAGGNTTFGSFTARGGPGGLNASGVGSNAVAAAPLGAQPTPVAPSGTNVITGFFGGVGIAGSGSTGGTGGNSPWGSGAAGGGTGSDAAANTGAGGGGGGTSGNFSNTGGNGGSGQIVIFY
jgi:hypothetical protein